MALTALSRETEANVNERYLHEGQKSLSSQKVPKLPIFPKREQIESGKHVHFLEGIWCEQIESGKM